jgi:hypothetical protein
MNFLADEGVDARIVERLRQEGHDVDYVAELVPGMTDDEVLDRALDQDLAEFEDAVAHEAARASGVSAIVTRDGGDFAKASLPIFDPHELLAAIAAAAGQGRSGPVDGCYTAGARRASCARQVGPSSGWSASRGGGWVRVSALRHAVSWSGREEVCHDAMG